MKITVLSYRKNNNFAMENISHFYFMCIIKEIESDLFVSEMFCLSSTHSTILSPATILNTFRFLHYSQYCFHTFSFCALYGAGISAHLLPPLNFVNFPFSSVSSFCYLFECPQSFRFRFFPTTQYCHCHLPANACGFPLCILSLIVVVYTKGVLEYDVNGL